MWIVVVLETYYPSVFHFDNKEDAIKCFNKQKNEDESAVHLAKVDNSYLYDWREEKEENIEDVSMEEWDIEWYTSK